MLISSRSVFSLVFAGIALFSIGTVGCQPSKEGVTFASIKPILDQRCITCHMGPNAKDGVDLSSHETIMKGGKQGALVVPGDPAASLLVKALHGADGTSKMPPQQAPLSEGQIKQIEDWIRAGAAG